MSPMGRFAASAASMVVLFGLRLMLFPRLVVLPNGHLAQGPSPLMSHFTPAEATAPRPPGASDPSGWVTYATQDPATRLRTLHARLSAQAEPGTMADTLELISAPLGIRHVYLTLAAEQAGHCAAISHLTSTFDGHAPLDFPATPQNAAGGCAVELAGFDRFLQQTLNAQDVMLVPRTKEAALPAVVLHVAGLAWGAE